MMRPTGKRYVVCFVVTAWAGGVIASASCCGDPQCEPPLSSDRTLVADADLPVAWTQPEASSFRIVVTTGPYRVSDFALDRLVSVMRNQAGLEVTTSEGKDTGLSGSDTLNESDVVEAGRAQIPAGNDAVLVIVVVHDTTAFDATYGSIRYEHAPRLTAVMTLLRAGIQRGAIGPVTVEAIEAATVLHEVGHWLGVPGRDFHTSAIDGQHCTNARCVMFKGGRAGPCAILANVCTGVPMTFCSDCAEELAEIQRLRQAGS